MWELILLRILCIFPIFHFLKDVSCLLIDFKTLKRRKISKVNQTRFTFDLYNLSISIIFPENFNTSFLHFMDNFRSVQYRFSCKTLPPTLSHSLASKCVCVCVHCCCSNSVHNCNFRRIHRKMLLHFPTSFSNGFRKGFCRAVKALADNKNGYAARLPFVWLSFNNPVFLHWQISNIFPTNPWIICTAQHRIILESRAIDFLIILAVVQYSNNNLVFV